MSDHRQLDNVAIYQENFWLFNSIPLHPSNSQIGSNAQFPFYVTSTKDPIKCCKISFIYHSDDAFFKNNEGLPTDTQL